MNDLVFQDDILLAALAFIDSFDDDTTLEIPVPSRGRVRKAKRANARMTSSQRTRNEIDRLRGVIAELETRLHHATDNHEQHVAAQDMTDTKTKALQQSKNAAHRQKTRRQHAQDENKRLREQLVQQTPLVHALEKLVPTEWHFQLETSMSSEYLMAAGMADAWTCLREHHDVRAHPTALDHQGASARV